MTRYYRANVALLLRVDSRADAADAVSELFGEHCAAAAAAGDRSALVSWEYAPKPEGGYDEPEEVEVGHRFEGYDTPVTSLRGATP